MFDSHRGREGQVMNPLCCHVYSKHMTSRRAFPLHSVASNQTTYGLLKEKASRLSSAGYPYRRNIYKRKTHHAQASK